MCARTTALLLASFVAVALSEGCKLPALQRLCICPKDSQHCANLTYYSSVDLSEPLENKTAVVVQHGASRDALQYFCAMYAAFERAGKQVDVSGFFIVAPLFPNSSSQEGDLYWSDSSWESGGQSDNATVSSYLVFDTLFDTFVNNSVSGVVFVGHSAGSQSLVRYAMGTQKTSGDVALRFVIANPGSYAYLNGRRPASNKTGTFADLTSKQRAACPKYNSWKYGLQNLNEYMDTAADIAKSFKQQDVIYLLGTEDTKPNYKLDQSCAANWQGANRYERGTRYFEYLYNFYGEKVHQKVDVVGVGHDEEKMFRSDQAIAAIFNFTHA